jgi:hypothetical protein
MGGCPLQQQKKAPLAVLLFSFAEARLISTDMSCGNLLKRFALYLKSIEYFIHDVKDCEMPNRRKIIVPGYKGKA